MTIAGAAVLYYDGKRRERLRRLLVVPAVEPDELSLVVRGS